MNIAYFLIGYRKENQILQKELATILKIGLSDLKKIENGSKLLSIGEIYKISKKLKISSEFLFEELIYDMFCKESLFCEVEVKHKIVKYKKSEMDKDIQKALNAKKSDIFVRSSFSISLAKRDKIDKICKKKQITFDQFINELIETVI